MKEQVLTTITSASRGVGSEFGTGLRQHAHHHLGVDEVLRAAEADKAYLGRGCGSEIADMLFFTDIGIKR